MADSSSFWLLFLAVLIVWIAVTWALARLAERRHPAKGQFLEIDGVRLHYIERGSGPPLVLLHGNGATLDDYLLSGIVDRAAETYRVIVFDRPGYGYSTRPRLRIWTPQMQAALLAKALAQLGVAAPILVGHSWGTLVAVALALRGDVKARGLLLLAGYFFPTFRLDVFLLSGPAFPVTGDLMRYTISPLLGWLARKAVIRKIFAPSPIPDRFAGFPMGIALRPGQLRASAEEAAIMIPAAFSLQTRYRALTMPVAIIAGDTDGIVDTATQSAPLHRAIAHSTCTILPKTGHMVHHTAPDRVMAAIDAMPRG